MKRVRIFFLKKERSWCFWKFSRHFIIEIFREIFGEILERYEERFYCLWRSLRHFFRPSDDLVTSQGFRWRNSWWLEERWRGWRDGERTREDDKGWGGLTEDEDWQRMQDRYVCPSVAGVSVEWSVWLDSGQERGENSWCDKCDVRNFHQGYQGGHHIGSNWPKNGTNPGLFQIRFQYILPKCTEIWSQSLGFVQFWANVTNVLAQIWHHFSYVLIKSWPS